MREKSLQIHFLPFLITAYVCIYNEEEPPSTVATRCKTRPTFGKAKVPPKSLKAGKNVRLANLTAGIVTVPKHNVMKK